MSDGSELLLTIAQRDTRNSGGDCGSSQHSLSRITLCILGGCPQVIEIDRGECGSFDFRYHSLV